MASMGSLLLSIPSVHLLDPLLPITRVRPQDLYLDQTGYIRESSTSQLLLPCKCYPAQEAFGEGFTHTPVPAQNCSHAPVFTGPARLSSSEIREKSLHMLDSASNMDTQYPQEHQIPKQDFNIQSPQITSH